MKTNKMFKVTSVCIEDIIQAIEDNYCGEDELTKIMLIKNAKKLNENEMKWIASKLSDAFCDTDFWVTLSDLFKQIVKKENEKGNN